MAAPRVTVAVVQRESLCHTARSLETLYANAGVPFDLVYVDGGAPASVSRLIDAEAARRGFHVLREDRFLEPNQGRNLALAVVDTEFIAFTDNDIVFGPDWLAHLLACADETGADLVGPLVCYGSQEFGAVHSAGGDMHVIENASGRALFHRYTAIRGSVRACEPHLVRRQPGTLEFHCLLARRSLFERIGRFDEGMPSAFMEWDLCLVARAAGARLMFEPAARVHHLLPPLFPLDLSSLPFFRQRWDRERNQASFEYFQRKWQLQPNDAALVASLNWHNDRRDIIFRYLRPDIFRHGVRRLRREFAGLLAFLRHHFAMSSDPSARQV